MLKTLKFIFFFAAILFVSKPILGYTLLNHYSPTEKSETLLFAKLFSKRKDDLIGDDMSECLASQQRISLLSPTPVITLLGFLTLLFSTFRVKLNFQLADLKQSIYLLPGGECTYLRIMKFNI